MLYNYTVIVDYGAYKKTYTNDYSIPFERVQDELNNIFWGADEQSGVILSVKVKKV